MAAILRKLISTNNASKPVGPYNQGIQVDGRMVFVSGCLGLDKDTNKLVPGDAVAQAEMAFKNMQGILRAADSDLDKVVKNTIYLKDLNDFAAINELYKKFFCRDYPARTCVQVAKLPLDAAVEVECIALAGNVNTTC